MNGILDLFFPEHCMHCDKKSISKTQVPLCLSCEIQLDSARKDGVQNVSILRKFKGVLPIKFAFSLFYFTNKGISQTLIHEAKYRGQSYLFKYYGKVLAYYLHEDDLFIKEKPDLIVAVPNNWIKRFSLGYNQADLFAKELSFELGIPIENKVLKKRMDRSSQTKRNKIERLQNLQFLYEMGLKADMVKGKHVLLVDDVITSGATIETCGQLLLQAGVKELSICSFMLVK